MAAAESEAERQESTLKEFLLTTSAHGLHKVAAANARSFARAVWMAIVLGAVALLIVQFEKLVARLLSEPLTTEINRNTQEFIFPDVLFCLTNAVEPATANRTLPDLDMSLANLSNNSVPLWASIGKLSTEKAAELTRRTLRSFATQNKLITDWNFNCMYNRKTCGDQVAVLHHEKYWTCRAFRPKKRVSDFYATPLELSVQIAPKSWTIEVERNYLAEGSPLADRGVMVQVYPGGTFPSGHNNRLYVPLSNTVTVDISFVLRQKVNLVKKPCSSKRGPKKGESYNEFDMCKIRSAEQALFNRCQCYHNVTDRAGLSQAPCFPLQTLKNLERQADVSTPPTSGIKTTLCAFNFLEEPAVIGDNCAEPCESLEYTLASNGKGHKRNSMAVITLRAAPGERPLLVRESLAYTEVDLLSDIGGAMCLCLGCSIITLLEFFELPVLSAYRRYKKR